MVESAGFENQYIRKGIVGSNPTASAKSRFLEGPPPGEDFFSNNPSEMGTIDKMVFLV